MEQATQCTANEQLVLLLTNANFDALATSTLAFVAIVWHHFFPDALRQVAKPGNSVQGGPTEAE